MIMKVRAFYADLLTASILVVAACLGLTYPAKADTGFQGAVRIERGSYVNVRLVTISSTSGTTLFSASTLRPDSMCRSNGNYIIWLGTVSATQDNTIHSNIAAGIPILSSETFKLDGSMTGTIFATCNALQASCEMRCIDGLVR